MARRLPRADAALYDGVVRSSLHLDHKGEGLRIARLDHQDCADILKHNQEVMDRGGSRTGSFGKVELCIPELELRNLKRRYPDLASKDREIKVKAWKKFLGTAEAKPWKVSQPKYSTVK